MRRPRRRRRPIGTLELRDGAETPPKTRAQLRRDFALALLLVLAGAASLAWAFWPVTLPGALGATLGLLLYTLTGYALRPRPVIRIPGRRDALLDEPLRIGEDVDADLQVLDLLLAPGRFVATSVLDFLRRSGASQEPKDG